MPAPKPVAPALMDCLRPVGSRNGGTENVYAGWLLPSTSMLPRRDGWLLPSRPAASGEPSPAMADWRCIRLSDVSLPAAAKGGVRAKRDPTPPPAARLPATVVPPPAPVPAREGIAMGLEDAFGDPATGPMNGDEVGEGVWPERTQVWVPPAAAGMEIGELEAEWGRFSLAHPRLCQRATNARGRRGRGGVRAAQLWGRQGLRCSNAAKPA